MTVFFTSDEHYLHKNVNRLCNRPFDKDDMTEGHEELIRRHNSVVGERDTVWHLGDFCWNYQRVGDFISSLNGRHCLVMGNHDDGHSCHKKSTGDPKKSRVQRARDKYLSAGFFAIYEETYYNLQGILVKLCHFPYWDDTAVEYEQRYPDWRPAYGPQKVLLRGHSHSKPDQIVKWQNGHLQIDVGVDGHDYTPWSEDELVKLIKEQVNDRT